jgi:hypothetical protein
MAMVHEFIRVNGRRPSAEELQRFIRAQARMSHSLSTRMRLGAARMVVRL